MEIEILLLVVNFHEFAPGGHVTFFREEWTALTAKAIFVTKKEF